MTRNGVGRLNLTIEAIDVREEDLSPKETALAILERPCLTEHEVPSPDGLYGIFLVCEVGDGE
jgi:hypothetical protein